MTFPPSPLLLSREPKQCLGSQAGEVPLAPADDSGWSRRLSPGTATPELDGRAHQACGLASSAPLATAQHHCGSTSWRPWPVMSE